MKNLVGLIATSECGVVLSGDAICTLDWTDANRVLDRRAHHSNANWRLASYIAN